MHDLKWGELPIERRLELCEKAGLAPCFAKQKWSQYIPQTKLRLAAALEELTGGVVTVGLGDWELLEYRQWIAEGRPPDF